MWQAVEKNFNHIRFFADGPNARWLSLVDYFVTTNFGTEPLRYAPVPLEPAEGSPRTPRPGGIHVCSGASC